MTTIAAKVLSTGKVHVAWDSQATSGNTASFKVNKVAKINDQFLVGGSGHLRYLNIVQRATVDKVHPFDLSQPDFDAEAWLIDRLVPAWGKALSKAMENNPSDEDPYGRCLVVIASRIFEVGVDFSVADMGDYAAVGSGGVFALAAMHLGKSAPQAVQVASELDLFTGGEVKDVKL